jgi:hypothetical protein
LAMVDRDENRAPGVARGDAFGLKAILQGRLHTLSMYIIAF